MNSSRQKRRSQINPAIEILEERRMLSADLTGVFTGALPAAIHTGNNNHLTIHVVDDGDASAKGQLGVDLFAVPDSASNGSEVLLGSITRNVNLKSGRGTNVNVRFADPATLADGQYTLVAQLDGSRLSNVNTTDSTIVSPSTVSVNQPSADLQSQMVTGPVSPIVIQDNSVSGQPASVLVKNVGNVAARGDVSVSFYLSPDQTLDSRDIVAGNLTGLGIKLKPGQGQVFGDILVPPSGTPAGNYSLFAVVTPGAGIAQKPGETGVGVASREVVVERPQVSSVTGNPIGQDNTLPPFPFEGPVTTPVPAAPVTATPTPATPAPATNCPPPSCDTGTQGSCDDGSQGSDCGDGSDSGDQTTDDGSDDQGQDTSSSDSSSQDTSGQDTSSQDTSGQDTSGQDTSGQDDSNQSSDNSGDTSSSDDSGSVDSGSDDSSGSDSGGDDSSGDDSGSDSSGDDSSGDDSSGDDSSGDDSGGDDGSTDAWHPLASATHKSSVGATTTQVNASSPSTAGRVSHTGSIRR